MYSWITQKMNHWKETGTLTILIALYFELLVVLWLSFFALFALETLLPTFITIRLSLANFLTFLILGTVLYLSLSQTVDESEVTPIKNARFFTWGVWIFGFILIALSLARFPLVGVVIFLVSYLFLWWLLHRFVLEK